MNSGPSVSVIVPMYNTEAYLPSCVDSLLNQTLNDIEVILVDDESPDACGDIAEEYALRDSRVKVVHRKNGGLGPARNSGLEVATGEYVGFVDSDDWVDCDMYERLYRAAKDTNSQIVFAELKRVRHGKMQKWENHPFSGMVLCGDEEIFKLRRSFYGTLPNKLTEDPVPNSVCPNLYSLRLIKDSGARFSAIRSEDSLFNTDVCKAAQSIAVVEGAPYCYRKDDQESITHTFRASTVDDYFEYFEALLEKSRAEPSSFVEECLKRATRRVIDYTRAMLVLIATSSLTGAEKRTLVSEALCRPIFVTACQGFPFWRLPLKQGIFFICMKYRLVGTAICLANIRSK